jgi:tRNA A37 methylthiotransferase MiaB
MSHFQKQPFRKVAIATLGCKVNRYESAALEESLQNKNFLLVPFNSLADVYVINTVRQLLSLIFNPFS